MTDSIPAGPVVYVLLGSAGRPIYVGAPRDFERRFREHARTKSWWPEVVDATWVPAPSWSAALRLEQMLIKRYVPTHNAQHVNDVVTEGDFSLSNPAEFASTAQGYIDRADANLAQAEKLRTRCLETHGVDIATGAVA